MPGYVYIRVVFFVVVAKKFRFNQGDFSPASRSFASYRACIGLEFLLFY